MRLLTWNVYFGGHLFEERREALLAELGRRRPEVIALQEVTEEHLPALAALPGYAMTDDDLGVLGYGVVILTRVAVRGTRTFDLPSQMGRKLVTVELGSGVTVASVHLESLDEADARLAQLAQIQQRLARLDRVVWCGDFNFKPDEDEQRALDPGWSDAWATLRPGEPGYTVDTDVNTMRYQLKEQATHKRIDRVMTRGVVARAIELVGTAAIDELGTFVSDHFGLEVDLG